MENKQRNTNYVLSDKTYGNEKISFLEKVAVFTFFAYIFSIFVFTTYANTNIISKIIFVAFCGVCCLVFFKTRCLKFDIYFWFFAAFMIYIYTSSLWAKDASLTFEKGFTIAQIVVFCLFAYSLFYSLKNYTVIDKIFYISGIAMCIYILGVYGIQNFLSMMQEGERMGEEVGQVNAIGMYAVVSLFIGLYYAMFKKRPINYVFVALLFFIALSTGSKKTIISIVLCAVLMFFLKFKSEISFKNIIATLIVVSLLILAFSYLIKLEAFESINHRMESIFNLFSGQGKVDSSTSVRMEMIKGGLEQFKKTPFTGIGIGNTGYINAQKIGWFVYLHNNYVELLAGGGLFGFIIYYSMYAYLLFNLIRLIFKYKNSNAVLALIILFLRLVFEIGAVTYYGKVTYIYLTYCFLVVKLEYEKLNKEIKRNEIYQKD